MNNIGEWLDREQEHKLAIEDIQQHENRHSHKKSLNLAIAKMDIAFARDYKAGRIINPHPYMLKRISNIW